MKKKKDYSLKTILKTFQDDVIARLMTFSNVLITSHQAFLTETALTNIAETTIYNLDCFEKQINSGNEVNINGSK